MAVDQQQDEGLVYAPSRGFRSALVVESPANFVVEREGRTLTASLVSDRDCTTLHFTVLGVDLPPDAKYQRIDGAARVRDDRGHEIAPHPRWQTAGMIRRVADGTPMLDWQLKLLPLASTVRSVELSFGGPAGEWDVTIPVETTRPSGVPARRIEASDTHQGIEITAAAVARTSDFTAVEIESTVAPSPEDLPGRPKRYVQGIGAHQPGRLSSELLTLRDDAGREYTERGGAAFAPAPANRQVVVFPPIPNEARTGVLEIPFVAVQERTDDVLALPIPSETDVTFLGCDAHVAVTRGEDGRVRVEITPRDASAERQLLYFGHIEVDGGMQIGMSVQHCAGQPIVVETPDPRVSRALTLRGPVIRLAGPWRLELAL